jgi:steroid delta-isomerase-like uncharacterized protein
MNQTNVQTALENIEAFNTGDWERLKKGITTDAVYEDMPSKRRLQGAGQFVEEFENWKKAGPDCKGKVLSSFVSGNTVIVEVNWKGTNTGPLGGQPPTGKTWDVNGCQVITIENDKIKELHQYYDMLSLMQQIGRIPK